MHSVQPSPYISLGEAIDIYIGALARAGKSPATLCSYQRLLNDFATVVRDKPPAELVLTDYERFLDRWVGINPRTGKAYEPSTLALGVSLVTGFARFLFTR